MLVILYFALFVLVLAVFAWSWGMLYLHWTKAQAGDKKIWLSFLWILGSLFALIGIPLLLHFFFSL